MTQILEKRTIQTSPIQNPGKDSSFREKCEALDKELVLDSTPSQNNKKKNEAIKNYHISAGFKNPAASSRVSQEIKKDSVNLVGKFMSPRKSHDVTYLSTHKKKVDASALAANSKSKIPTKKGNQTINIDSPGVK